VRDRNQKLILRLLFENGPMSQSRIVQLTGLRAPTVFRIFVKLEEDRYIQPCEAPEKRLADLDSERKGRRPAYFCVVPQATYAIGGDFSASGASISVVNFVNEVIHHQMQEFPADICRDEVLSRIEEMIESGMDACGIEPHQLAGIGIGAPGIVNTETGVVQQYSRIEGLEDYSIKDHLTGIFGVPVFVHNNASVIAASEYHYGAGNRYDSVLAVLVRSGIGAAFVNHGEIFLNGHTTALELGRVREHVWDAGKGTSDQPTLESFVSERALLEKLSAVETVSTWEDVERAVADDRIAEVLEDQGALMTTAVRNLYHILHPEAILIISRYSKLARFLTGVVGDGIPEATTLPVTYDSVKACLGATDLVFEHFFSDRTPDSAAAKVTGPAGPETSG